MAVLRERQSKNFQEVERVGVCVASRLPDQDRRFALNGIPANVKILSQAGYGILQLRVQEALRRVIQNQTFL